MDPGVRHAPEDTWIPPHALPSMGAHPVPRCTRPPCRRPPACIRRSVTSVDSRFWG